jgi:hypothetical protein
MAIGTTNISMFDIATELTFPTTDIELLDGLYDTSATAGAQDSGNYHNYNNMALGGILSFKESIYDYWSGTATGNPVAVLSHWAGYTHDIEWEVSFVLDNQSNETVDVELWFGPNDVSQSDQFYTISLPKTTTDTQIPYVTTLASKTTGYSNYGGYYWIHMVAIPVDANITKYMDVVSSYDTDGVGASTNRTTWTSVNGTFDFVSNGGAFSNWIVAGNNQNTGIGWNKRTTFEISFYG